MNTMTYAHKSDARKRILIVGHKSYFSLHMPSSTTKTEFCTLDFYHGSDSTAFELIERFKPHILFAFRPELLPASVLLGFAGTRIGFSSEIFPNTMNNSTVDPLHQRKLEFFNGCSTRLYDYLYHYDRASSTYLENSGIRMSGFPPFPISEELFTAENADRDIDVLFIGRMSYRRIDLLEKLKRKKIKFVCIEHGLYGRELATFLLRSRIVLNIHAEKHTSFEPRVLLGAAAGAHVISETISLPDWLSETPFTFIDMDDSDWPEVIENMVRSPPSSTASIDEFRLTLQKLCSASGLIERIVENIDNGSDKPLRTYISTSLN